MRETRNCQNCKNDFVIDEADFTYYERMRVPAPTWCPKCRMARRLSFSNVFQLYKRACDKCGKSMVTMYAPENKRTVYCMPCWWSDSWDGTEYARDYDPTRPFLEQVRELHESTPYAALEQAYLNQVNSDYTNFAGHNKNCYLTFWADFCENVLYSMFLNTVKDSVDCYRMKDCELCYESIGGYKSYRTYFSDECDACTNVWFSRSCSGCTDCFGCVNMRNKNHCIFNVQYSADEYKEKIKEFNLQSRESIEKVKKQVKDFWLTKPYRSYTGNSMNVNVTGDYIYESKNAKEVYMVSGVEDSRYVQFVSVLPAKDSYDYSGWGNNANRIYECNVVGEGASDIKFSHECWPNVMDIEYSMYAIACKHAFGCVNLKRKEYSILNKQYTKEEYEDLVKKIRMDMEVNPYIDTKGRAWKYGEYFPVEFSPFGYNESIAQVFFPKKENEAREEGYLWYTIPSSSHSVTIQGIDLPDTITETSDDITHEVIECESCKKAYKITQTEFLSMRKLNIPLPSSCFNCRQKERFIHTNPPDLYNRTCMQCDKDIKTSFSPDRPEIVYCESCYQKEIL